MSYRLLTTGFFLAAFWLLPGQPDRPGLSAQENGLADANSLSLEVDALQTLRALEVTDRQLQALSEVAATTAGELGKRAPAKASGRYLRYLLDLRAALIANDDEKITDLEDKVGSVADEEKTELDDGVELTKAAREKAPAVLRRFTLSQVTSYISTHIDDLVDPYERLTQGFADGRTLKGQDWKDTRDEIADDVSQAVAGVDAEKGEMIVGQVKALLDKAQKMKADEYKQEAEALRKEARDLVGDLGPLDVLKNTMERVVATLLSNPRLPAALAARLKAGESK